MPILASEALLRENKKMIIAIFLHVLSGLQKQKLKMQNKHSAEN